MSLGTALVVGFIIFCACVALVVFGLGRWLDSLWDADHVPAKEPWLSLETRKKLAAPLYWAAGKWLTWANWVDGPQPRKPKA